ITGPVDQAIEKSEDRKIRGRKMKRDSTTKPTKQTKAEDAKNRVSHRWTRMHTENGRRTYSARVIGSSIISLPLIFLSFYSSVRFRVVRVFRGLSMNGNLVSLRRVPLAALLFVTCWFCGRAQAA